MLNCFSGNGIKIWRKIAKVYFSNYLSMLSCTKSWRGKSQRFKYLPLISDKDRRLTNIYPENSFFRTFFFLSLCLCNHIAMNFPRVPDYSSILPLNAIYYQKLCPSFVKKLRVCSCFERLNLKSHWHFS